MGWVLGFMLAALAGVLIAPASGMTVDPPHELLALNGFAAAVVGRLRSLPMTFVGALILGLITYYWPRGICPASDINAGLAAVLSRCRLALLRPAGDAPGRPPRAGRCACRPPEVVPCDRPPSVGAVLLVVVMVVLAAVVARQQPGHPQGLALGIGSACRWSSCLATRGRSRCASSPSWALAPSSWARVGGGASWCGCPPLAIGLSAAVGVGWWHCPHCASAACYLALATFAFGAVMYSRSSSTTRASSPTGSDQRGTADLLA